MSDGTAIREQCGRHGVAEHMRIHPFAEPRPLGIVVKAFPGALGSHPCRWIVSSDKNGRMVIMTALQVPMQSVQCHLREIDFPDST